MGAWGPVVLSLVGVLAAAPQDALAQSSNVFEQVDPGLEDGAYFGIVVPLNVGLAISPITPNPIQTPPALDRAVREALVWEGTQTAATISDVLLLALLAGSLVTPPIAEVSFDSTELSAALVSAEALLTVSLVTGLTKHLTGRQRPYAYFGELDTGYSSFFSGHTSMTFAAATMLTVFAYEFDWLGEDTRWLIPTGAYLLAATTGYLRIASDRHWLSDVLVGALVGTGTSYLVFTVRTR